MHLFRSYKKRFSLVVTVALFALTVVVSFHGHGTKPTADLKSAVSASLQEVHDCPVCLGRQQLTSSGDTFVRVDIDTPDADRTVLPASLAHIPSLKLIVSEPARGPPSV